LNNKLRLLYPEASELQIRAAIKYQDKFSLTLENLKCLNPDCNKMRVWNQSSTNFKYCCSSVCTKIMLPEINKNRGLKRKGIKQSEDQILKRKLSYSLLDQKAINKKREETCLKRFGVPNQNQNPEVLIKRKKTVSEKPTETKRKSYILAKETYFQKTGYGHHFSNPNVRIKKNNSNYKHYADFKHWDDKDFWINNFITESNNFDYIKCMNHFNCKQPAAHNQIKKLGIEYVKIGATSLQEQAIIPYLESLGVSAVANDRTIIPNQELDIWIPSLKLAIEWNGSYWHSYHETLGTSPQQLDYDFCKYRHQRKALACLEAGIRLLQLYEDINLSNWEEQIDKFIVYDPDTAIDIYDLDSGCYPLGADYKILEPESRIVLKDRVLWTAGKLKSK
jgi:hypothetical protein